jgi:hypothetical protein
MEGRGPKIPLAPSRFLADEVVSRIGLLIFSYLLCRSPAVIEHLLLKTVSVGDSQNQFQAIVDGLSLDRHSVASRSDIDPSARTLSIVVHAARQCYRVA